MIYSVTYQKYKRNLWQVIRFNPWKIRPITVVSFLIETQTHMFKRNQHRVKFTLPTLQMLNVAFKFRSLNFAQGSAYQFFPSFLIRNAPSSFSFSRFLHSRMCLDVRMLKRNSDSS